MSVSLWHSGPGGGKVAPGRPTVLPSLYFCLSPSGRWFTLPVTLIRNKRLLRDPFPDSLLVSSQVHIEIHWKFRVGLWTFRGNIRLYDTAHRCGARGHEILPSTVTAQLALTRPASHDLGAFAQGESDIRTEWPRWSGDACTSEDGVQWQRHPALNFSS